MFFRRTDSSISKIKEAAGDMIAQRLARLFIAIQKFFVKLLTKGTAKLSNGQLKILFVVLFIGWGACSLFMAMKFSYKMVDQRQVYPTSITTSQFRTHDQDSSITAIHNLSQEFAVLNKFKQYLDTLKSHDKHAFDSLVSARPGLMDSVAALETMILSTNEK